MKSALAALLIAVVLVPCAHAGDDFHGLPPAGAAAPGASQNSVCAACPGTNRLGMTPLVPNLGGPK